MPSVELKENWHGYSIPIGTFDLSEEGERVIRANSDNLYSIEDATERFMDEIDYYSGKIAELEQSQIELARMAVRETFAMNYDEKFDELRWRWEINMQICDALCKDLGVLLGENE